MKTSALAPCLLLLAASVASAQPVPVDGEYEFSIDWTSLNEEAWIEHLARFKDKPDAQGLEVGCFEGRSTIWFLEEILTHPTSRMTCIDVFTGPIEKRFDNNIRVSGLGDRAVKLKGYSQDWLRELEFETYDFAYIDGCHLARCALTDAVLTWDLIKPGGIIIFDDYGWHMREAPKLRPKIAFDAFVESFIDQIKVLQIGRQLIVRKLESAGRTRPNLVGNPLVHTRKWERLHDAARKKSERLQQQGR